MLKLCQFQRYFIKVSQKNSLFIQYKQKINQRLTIIKSNNKINALQLIKLQMLIYNLLNVMQMQSNKIIRFIYIQMNSAIVIKEQDSLLQESQIKQFLNQSIISSISPEIGTKNMQTLTKNNKIFSNFKSYSLTTLKGRNVSINVSNLKNPSRQSKQQKKQKQKQLLKKSQEIIKRFYPNKIVNNDLTSLTINASFKDKSTMPSICNSSTINPEQLKMSLLRQSRIQKNQRKQFFSVQQITKRQTSTLMNLNKVTNQFYFTHNKFFEKKKYEIKSNICLTKKLMISQTKLNQLVKQRKGIPTNPFKRSFRQSDFIET